MRRVLIVESDLASGMECLRTFAVAGFQVEHVSTGTETLAALDRAAPDVIVLNLLFRQGQAIRLLQAIRSHPRTSARPVVAFTRTKVESLIDDARLEGATECVILGQRGAQDLVNAVNKVLPLPATAPETTAPAPVPAPPPSSRLFPPTPEPAPKALPSAPRTQPPSPEPQSPPKPEAPSVKMEPLQTLKEVSRRLFGAPDQTTRQRVLGEFQEKAQAFAAEAGARHCEMAANLSGALAALLKELSEKPKSVSSSLVRTINQAVESLEALLAIPLPPSGQAQPHFQILAVDDEPSVRLIINRALASVQLAPDNAGNTAQALELAKTKHYDLFVLDINMPGPSGFELCQKLRATPAYRETPVIFVTGMDDFQSRIRSASSGGDDFIGKPFLPKELAIKALIHLLGCRKGPPLM